MARWRVRLSPSAQRDLAGILAYTMEEFGPRQTTAYEKTITLALSALRAGPELRGSVTRSDIGEGLRSLHVARQGRRGRHLIIYRTPETHTIDVVRILHDRMDLAQHLP